MDDNRLPPLTKNRTFQMSHFLKGKAYVVNENRASHVLRKAGTKAPELKKNPFSVHQLRYLLPYLTCVI